MSMQASLLPADCSTGQRGGKKDSSKAMAALDIITPAVALPIEFAHPRGLTPPSSSTQLGVPAAPQTNMHSMLAESCGAQPPSTSASNGRKMQAHCMRTLHGARAHRLVHTPCFRKHRQRAPFADQRAHSVIVVRKIIYCLLGLPGIPLGWTNAGSKCTTRFIACGI